MTNEFTPKPPGYRFAVASMVIVLGLFVYTMIVVGIASWIGEMNIVIELIYYTFFGIAWIWPAYKVLVWNGRANPSEQDQKRDQ